MPSRSIRRALLNSLATVLAVLGCSVALTPRAASAAQFALCGPGFAIPAAPQMPNPSTIPGAIDIEADDAQGAETGTSTLRGNVLVRRGTSLLSSDEVEYTLEGESETIDVFGSLRFWDQGLYVTGTHGRLLVNDEITIVDNSNFKLLDAHAHGSATRVQLTGEDLVNANNARYSTCNPDEEDWFLEAEQLELDKADDTGTARNVWVTFKDVPIFFSPYLSFPLSDKRKSGFLAPSAGVSDSTGVEASVPYYFNIAPNMDATVASRAMADRGVQLQGEFRYLFDWGEGVLAAEAMGNDRKTDDSRFAVSVEHYSQLSSRWRTDVNFDWVSDPEYFDDLGSNLAISSQTFLEQRADLSYAGDNFSFFARAQHFQSVDPTLPGTSRPYERLPQFYLATAFPEKNLRLNANTTAEVVHFDRSDGVTGVRWDLRPDVSFPYRTASGFVVPKAVVRYTGYSLDDQPVNQSDNPSRLIPTLSLDSGLFFERPLEISSRKLTQTLEPRLYYLYTPFDAQDDLPVFDTGEYTFSFGQLFRDDRFSGVDRVSDANQLTLAVTSRFLDTNSGAELGRVSIGQIRYFRDRKVNLPGNGIDTSSGSNLVAEVVANLDDHLRVSTGTQWDFDNSETARNTVTVRYQPDERRVLNLAYRYIRDSVEQTDVSFAWPVSRHWRAVGRVNYALDDKRIVDAFSGFEYESCCWGLRLVGRHYLTGSNAEYNTGVFVQFVLKGLTSIGNADDFLGRNVPGYRNEF